jgi:starch synthase (maltosyl-transferring)
MPAKDRRLDRVVIECVTPQLEGGRYPVKRLQGDSCEVSAHIFMDGHDLVAGRLRFRPVGEREWRTAPLSYEEAPDRWVGSFPLERLGRWQFTVEGWPDRFRTWREDLAKRLDAGQEVSAELLEGAALLALAARHRRGRARVRLERAADEIADAKETLEERLRVAFDDEIEELAAGPLSPQELTRYAPALEVVVDPEAAGFAAWYEMFPRSLGPEPGRHGNFADAAERLPALAEMGFDVVYLPPIHPIGRTHRKGRNNQPVAQPGDVGSPWAIGGREGGHTAVHPELGTLEDFERFVQIVKSLGMEVALDIAFQCSPDHPWIREHPDWFFIRQDGTLRYAENPPKKYEDIYPLNYWCEDREGLWNACRDVFLFWIERGVRTFRVDNPHTKPFAFWEWLIDDIKQAHPETIFLSEAFTRPNRMRNLAKLGFTQSYTYFTWRNEPWELREYLTELTTTEMVEYFRPNFFANTPDILHEYLQKGGRPAFRVRLTLAATLSPVYGMYSGFELCENVPLRSGSEEYLHSEKYELRWRDWNAPGNLNAEIHRLNRIRRDNPALQRLGNVQFLHSENDRILCYRKYASDNELLIAVNIDPDHAHETLLHLPLESLGLDEDEPFDVDDLLTGAHYRWHGRTAYIRLDPAEHVAHILRLRRSER